MASDSVVKATKAAIRAPWQPPRSLTKTDPEKSTAEYRKRKPVSIAVKRLPPNEGSDELELLLRADTVSKAALLDALRRRNEELREVGAEAPFSAAEVALLEAGGFAAPSEEVSGPSEEALSDYVFYVAGTSVPLVDAANFLNINVAQLEKMIAARQVYAITLEGNLRLPLFQFTKEGLLPGLEQVLEVLDPSLPSTAVYRFFITQQESLRLYTADNATSTCTTPYHWLSIEGDPQAVVEIARDFYVT